MGIGFHPRLLKHLFCIVWVSCDPIDPAEYFIRVPLPKLSKGRLISRLSCRNQYRIGCSSKELPAETVLRYACIHKNPFLSAAYVLGKREISHPPPSALIRSTLASRRR